MARTRSLRTQIDECHDLINKELDAGTERPARLTLLKAKLDSLMELFRQESANSAVAVENAELKRRVEELTAPKEPAKSPADALLDQQVAEMMARHNWGMAENKSTIQLPVKMTPPPLSRSESTAHIAVGGSYVTNVDDEEFVT
jgi:hypothetical protein